MGVSASLSQVQVTMRRHECFCCDGMNVLTGGVSYLDCECDS